MLHRQPVAAALGLALVLLLVTCSEPTEPGQSFTPNLDVIAPVVFFGAGDISGCSSTGDEQTATLLDGLLAANPAARVFAVGDLAYQDATAADFQNCYDPTWGRFKPKTIPIAGNHEYNTGTATAYFDYFNGVGVDSGVAGKRSKGYYSFNTGAWHVVVLNANTSYVGTKAGTIQETWLRSDLAATAQPCILAFWHQPLVWAGDTVIRTYVQDFWRDLYAAGADLIINGHQHYYERYTPMNPNAEEDPTNGIRQILVGTGGKSVSTPSSRWPTSQILIGSTFGVIMLTLGDGTYSWQFMPVAGKSLTDSGTGTCHGSAPPPLNAAPTAAFTSSCTNLSCSFADGSSDSDGFIAGRSWTFGDGGASTATNPSHTYAAGGTYSVGLTVTDDDGATNSITHQVSVSPANQSPTASFTRSCTNLVCNFTDTSTDPDGTITSRSWTFGDGGTSTATNPSHTYAAAGTYVVGLTVTDNQGAQGSTSTQLTVSAPNSPPTAAFTSSCAGLSCSFTDASTDTDGTVVGWSWNFGDGTPLSTAKSPSHSYDAAGTYTVTLTATDDKGATGSTSKPVIAMAIALTTKGRKVKGVEFVDLTWSGATSQTVDLYRNGSISLPGTLNDGAQTDSLNRRGKGTFTYQVCEAGSGSVCSNQSTVAF